MQRLLCQTSDCSCVLFLSRGAPCPATGSGPQEDILEEPAPRMFWPREIWGRYADTLAAFKEPGNRKAAVQCLNHMV